MSAAAELHRTGDDFRHDALLYAGLEGFVEGTLPFIREGIAAGEPVLVVVDREKVAMLEEALGDDRELVLTADMAELGANPAWIIPAWREFVQDRLGPGRSVRGIGEPISARRGRDELVECQRHEALLNVAFSGGPAWSLLCPYDVEQLGDDVLAEAERTHPFVVEGGARRSSATYPGTTAFAEPLAAALPEPPAGFREFDLHAGSLEAFRSFVAEAGASAGLGFSRTNDLAVAAYEVATNTLRHGGGRGRVRVWCDDGAVICEVRDEGRIEHPLVGRERPSDDQPGGRGMWMITQLCDLVQLRAFDDGGVVRMHIRLP